MAATELSGELVNKPLADTEAEDPLSKTPASVHPDKNVGPVLGATSSPTSKGKRDRKQVEFFAPAEKKEVERLIVKEGKGVRLGDIPNVLFRLQKTTGRDELLEELHFLLYRRKGKLQTRKREIQNFSGYPYSDAEKEAELKKDEEKLGRWKTERLNQLLDLLDLPRGKDEAATKEGKVARIIQFLEAPEKLSTKDLQQQEAKRKAQGERKRKREGKAAEKQAKAEARADKKAAKTAKQADKRASKRAKKTQVEEDVEEDDEAEEVAAIEEASYEEEDELPLGLASKVPSNAELEQSVMAILQGVNVVDFSLKQLLEQLHEKYGVDFGKLKRRKQLIKQVAISYCAARGPPAGAEEADEEAAEEGDEDAEAPVEDELEQEAKDEIMQEAGVPSHQQDETTLEDAITAVPAPEAASGQAASPAASKPAATEKLEAKAPVPNVNFSADNA